MAQECEDCIKEIMEATGVSREVAKKNCQRMGNCKEEKKPDGVVTQAAKDAAKSK